MGEGEKRGRAGAVVVVVVGSTLRKQPVTGELRYRHVLTTICDGIKTVALLCFFS